MAYDCSDSGGGGGGSQSWLASPSPPLLPSGVQGPDPDLFRIRKELGSDIARAFRLSPFDPIIWDNATPLLSSAAANLFLPLV